MGERARVETTARREGTEGMGQSVSWPPPWLSYLTSPSLSCLTTGSQGEGGQVEGMLM